MNGHQDFVAGCTTKDCAAHPYRMGKNPALVGKRQSNKGSFRRKTARDAVFNDPKPVYMG